MIESTEPPRSLQAAIGLWAALAAFLLVQTVFSWADREELERQLVAHHVAAPDQAGTVTLDRLLLNTALAVVFAAGYVAAGVLLRKRRPWARIGVCALFAVQLVIVLGGFSFSAANLIVLALGGAAAWFSWTTSSTKWVTGEHG
ncbi:hypothetical protein GCM10027271_13920 [Saccharopolyspora gloriosae]|uniref:Uncharacterized protein n=1 Tax=Saccharopolyspora gloriosae TaxID=455344 RepID=A0A840N4N6_9PSEU|nr:hypothetical protein [Saccharopolyspora gloriosae]MBB5066946.1 hypothetical protein [Saccharopolyspora gloriosae]